MNHGARRYNFTTTGPELRPLKQNNRRRNVVRVSKIESKSHAAHPGLSRSHFTKSLWNETSKSATTRDAKILLEKDRQIQDLKETVRDLEQQTKERYHRNVLLEEENVELRTACAHLTKKVNTLEEYQEKMRSENVWEIRTALRHAEHLRIECDNLFLELDRERKKSSNYHVQLRGAIGEINSLESHKDSLMEKISELERQMAFPDMKSASLGRSNKREYDVDSQSSATASGLDSSDDSRHSNVIQTPSQQRKLSKLRSQSIKKRMGGPLPIIRNNDSVSNVDETAEENVNSNKDATDPSASSS
mmetsp:Transcript_16244/g.29209  ORF Transcript_16244/g.29209 Transcript_16244/m.29209 type:complete len:304 (+) Transcript_16244:34-945(+)